MSEGCHDATGGTVGGQVGYRWQTGPIVFGVEAQGNWADFTGDNVSLVFPADRNRTKIDAFGLFTGQIGYAWNNALLYVKGGAAVVDDKYSIVTDPGGRCSLPPARRVGAAWSASASNTASRRTGRPVSNTTTCSWARSPTTSSRRLGAFAGTDNIKQDVDLFTARINYRFGGPIVARY